MADQSGVSEPAPVNSEPTPVNSAPAPPKKARGPWATLVSIGLLALSKAKLLLVGLKALPFAKLLLTSGTMLASIALYAWSAGLPFAVGFVFMILIHELGHGYAMRRHKLAASLPIFIPFFGALISMKDQPRTPLVEAEVAIAGPVAGAAAASFALLLYFVTHQALFLVLANVGFLLNLFNLTPFGFLDGGRVVKLFSRKGWLVGAAILAVMFALTRAPQLLLIGLMALPTLLGRRPQALGDDQVSRTERLNMACHYFGLCAFLAAGMYVSQRLLHPI